MQGFIIIELEISPNKSKQYAFVNFLTVKTAHERFSLFIFKLQ